MTFPPPVALGPTRQRGRQKTSLARRAKSDGLVTRIRAMRRILLPVLALTLLGSPAVRAAKVKVWHQHKPAHFDKGHLHRAVVSNEGTLRLSKQLKPFAGLEATHVWDVVEDKKGNLYAATGDGGKIYRV